MECPAPSALRALQLSAALGSGSWCSSEQAGCDKARLLHSTHAPHAVQTADHRPEPGLERKVLKYTIWYVFYSGTAGYCTLRYCLRYRTWWCRKRYASLTALSLPGGAAAAGRQAGRQAGRGRGRAGRGGTQGLAGAQSASLAPSLASNLQARPALPCLPPRRQLHMGPPSACHARCALLQPSPCVCWARLAVTITAFPAHVSEGHCEVHVAPHPRRPPL